MPNRMWTSIMANWIKAISHPLSSSLNWFKLRWELLRDCARLTNYDNQWLINCHQLSSSFGRRIRVDRTLAQTLASQLSSSFDRRMRVDRTLVQTLASQLSSSFDRRIRVDRTLVQTRASQLPSTRFSAHVFSTNTSD
jgi:hypothetical protein